MTKLKQYNDKTVLQSIIRVLKIQENQVAIDLMYNNFIEVLLLATAKEWPVEEMDMLDKYMINTWDESIRINIVEEGGHVQEYEIELRKKVRKPNGILTITKGDTVSNALFRYTEELNRLTKICSEGSKGIKKVHKQWLKNKYN